jgi:SNF2 family DNA or RNA helicase
LLRRVKAEVELHLPPKYEKIVLTPLSELQQTYYNAITKGQLREMLHQKYQVLYKITAVLSNSSITTTTHHHHRVSECMVFGECGSLTATA